MKFFTLLTLSALASMGLAHPNQGAVAHAHAEHHVARAAGSTKHQKNNGTNQAATDHIPKFRPAQCVCPAPVCDPRLNKASTCSCKAAAAMACYIASNGACAKPAERACGS